MYKFGALGIFGHVSNLTFKLVSDSYTETDNGISIGDKTLTQAIKSIRSNDALRNFSSGANILVPAPKRVYKQCFE